MPDDQCPTRHRSGGTGHADDILADASEANANPREALRLASVALPPPDLKQQRKP